MEIWSNFLCGAGGAALVTGLFLVIKWVLDRKAQKEDRAMDRKHTNRLAYEQRLQELNDMICSLIVVDRTILYDRIKTLAKAHIQKGYISIADYEDLKEMHDVYHTRLDGNGFLDGLMAQVEKLEKRVM